MKYPIAILVPGLRPKGFHALPLLLCVRSAMRSLLRTLLAVPLLLAALGNAMSSEEQAELDSAMLEVDTDKDGTLSLAEIETSFFGELNKEAKDEEDSEEWKEVQSLFAKADNDGDKKLDAKELATFLQGMREAEDKVEKDEE